MMLVKAASSSSSAAAAAAAAAMAAAPAPQSFCSPRLPLPRLHPSSPVSPSLLRLAPSSSSSSLPLRVSASSAEPPEAASLTGVVFEPFQEVQDQLVKVSPSRSVSLARHCYADSSEAAINEQINIEYSASYFYHTLFAYFDRDNVALPGLAKFFKESSDEERDHAEKLIKYQNMRGGKVKLQTILAPTQTEFDDEEKGDALYAMELTLAMEKLVNEKLLHLHRVADEAGDAQLTDFIEGEFLKSQVEDIKKIAEYVSQLRRVGKGHGVYHFDLQLQ